jgi:hypothetical protein
VIAEFCDEDEVGRYVSAMRDQLQAGNLDEHAAQAAQAIGRGASHPASAVLAALPEDNAGPPSSGESQIKSPFFSRSPAVSLLQTSLEDEARKRGAVHEPKHRLLAHIVGFVESLLHSEKFGPHDADWVTVIAKATLDRLAMGNHPFNPVPAEFEIPEDNARVVVVGDWGSGLPRARAVAGFMGQEVQEAIAAGQAVHVVHLGDVYYSGDPVEYKRRVLADGMWPVTAEMARGGVTSWSLNGNHDMYSGGWGFFDTLLAEERFAKQRSPDGKPTSWFRIKTPSWDLAGLDTSWDPEVLSLGQKGVLADPQAEVLQRWAGESDRRLMLLSHHQLVSSYDLGDLGSVLPHKLEPLFTSKRIAAWLWGHEHRCMAFSASHGVPFQRCIGHGGIPVPARDENTPIPAPGVWQDSGSFEENDARWNTFGFAVLDFDGPRVQIRYLDDAGKLKRTESID